MRTRTSDGTVWLAFSLFTVILTLSLAHATPAQAACVGGMENGIQEGDESCDDGPANPCCKPDCTADSLAAGSTCDDYNDCTVAGTSRCNSAGDCGGGQSNSGAVCRVRNGLGQPESCVQRICNGAVCSGPPTDLCSDGNPCTADVCLDPTTYPVTCGASHPPLLPGTPCETDGDACTVEVCDAVGACVFVQDITCPPSGNPCKLNVCTDGTCKLEVTEGAACASDGLVCTDDQCNKKGQCKHFPRTGVSCDDGNPCTVGESCGTDGKCANGVAGNNSLPCEDYNVCTAQSVCNNGQCVGVTCATNNTCPFCGVPCRNELPSCGCLAL